MLLTYPSPVPRPVVVFGSVLASVAVGAGCGRHTSPAQRAADEREKQARDLARQAGLSVDVQDFLARYASAAAHRFEVTYAPSPSGTTVVLVQDPPRRRVDVVTPPVTRSVFV